MCLFVTNLSVRTLEVVTSGNEAIKTFWGLSILVDYLDSRDEALWSKYWILFLIFMMVKWFRFCEVVNESWLCNESHWNRAWKSKVRWSVCQLCSGKTEEIKLGVIWCILRYIFKVGAFGSFWEVDIARWSGYYH